METQPPPTAQTEAAASTGPKTPAGKRRSSANATTHGLRSTALVVAGLETEADWERHLRGVVASLEPANYLQAFLVADIAGLLWRLTRVARYEADAATVGAEQVEQTQFGLDHATVADLAAAKEAAGFAWTGLRALLLADKPDDTPILPRPTVDALGLLADEGGVDTDGEQFAGLVPPSLRPLGLGSYQNVWTMGLYRRVALAICCEAGEPLEVLLVRACARAQRLSQSATNALAEAESEVARLRRVALLPAAVELDKVTRYEAHLRRSLDRALAQLQALQAAS